MNASTKIKIRDWFIITRIRILNFIKEHKYASAFIGVLLLSMVVALIVRAADDEYIKDISVSTTGSGRGISAKTEADDGQNKVAPNFSAITYTISYFLGEGSDECKAESNSSNIVDQVTIEATIPANSNLTWNTADETTFSSVTDVEIDGNKYKKLTVLIPEVNACSAHTQSFSLSVSNADKNTSIKPKIVIKGGSNGKETEISSESIPEIKTTYDDNKVFQLTPKVVAGVAKKISATQRDARFGLLLGIESSSDKLELKNSKISTSVDAFLLATQGANNDALTIYNENTTLFNNNKMNGNYFGVTDSSKHLFATSVLPDLRDMSGSILGISKINSSDAVYGRSDATISAPVLTFTGDNNVILEKYPDSSNITYRDANLDDARVTSSSGQSKISEIIYKEGNILNSKDITLKDLGSYEIHYKTEENNNSTEMIKKVKIVEPQNKDYSLIGPKTIYVAKKSSYTEKGLYSASSNKEAIKGTDYTVKYMDTTNNAEVSIDKMTDPSISYEAVYSIINKVTDENTTIKRTIKVVDSLPSISSKKVITTTSNIYAGETNNNHNINVDSKEIECNKENNCTYKLGTDGKVETYTISTNTYITNIIKNLNIVPIQYKLSINNISPYFEITNKIDSNFFVIGSYYVTAKSTRAESSDVNVKLRAKIKDKESEATITNKEYDSGIEKTLLTNDIYVDELNEDVKVDSSSKKGLTGNYYTAAMGEEITLSSNFEYSYDADDTLKELTMTIPVDKNLIPTAYNDNITGKSSYFYYDITYEGQKTNEAPKYEIKYYSNGSEINPSLFDSEDIENSTIIDNIVIKLKYNEDTKFEIKPGTNILIKTKYKVRSYKAESEESKNLNDSKFSLNPSFSWVGSDGKAYTKKSESDTPNVYITPYKIRADVGIGFDDNYNRSKDITLDASKNRIYTVYTPISVTAPTMNINSSYFGYSRIKSIPVIFELPEGINYVYNSKYENEPSVSYNDNKTVLTYYYYNVEPNSWIEPIYFDFNVDVTTTSGDLTIKTYVGNLSATDFSINNDQSSIDKYKTITNKIHINNEEKVSYGQYIYSNGKYVSNISKNESFELSTKIHNNTNTDILNATVYTVLPYQDTDQASSFNGTLELENLPDNSLCTSDKGSKVTNGTLTSEIKWQSCLNFKNSSGRYSKVSAYKTPYGTLNANGNLETNVKVYTIDNKPGDKYVIKSFLTYSGSDYISFKNALLEVVDKEITGVVWEDFNFDGIMDKDESKISTVSLKLYNSSDELLQTTTPDDKGKYVFTGLSEGSYYVVAEFNTDKYGLTNSPSDNFYDKSRLSVFKAEKVNNDSSKLLISKTETNEEDKKENIEENEVATIVKTDSLLVEKETRSIRNINLGLSLKKKFKVKMNKYITRAEVTNALGIITRYDYGNTKLAKLDVKNINNLKIKVIYTIELQNVKYYPGYITKVTETIPDGMNFNPDYDENKGWELGEDGNLYNRTLENDLIRENEKRYLTIAFDITRKEAGSFINYASADDIKILGGEEDEN